PAQAIRPQSPHHRQRGADRHRISTLPLRWREDSLRTLPHDGTRPTTDAAYHNRRMPMPNACRLIGCGGGGGGEAGKVWVLSLRCSPPTEWRPALGGGPPRYLLALLFHMPA